MAEAEVKVLTGVKGGAQGHVEGSIGGCSKCSACREQHQLSVHSNGKTREIQQILQFTPKAAAGALQHGQGFSASCVALKQCQQGHLTLHQQCIACMNCELMG